VKVVYTFTNANAKIGITGRICAVPMELEFLSGTDNGLKSVATILSVPTELIAIQSTRLETCCMDGFYPLGTPLSAVASCCMDGF
jgi:hypothetical protein